MRPIFYVLVCAMALLLSSVSSAAVEAGLVLYAGGTLTATGTDGVNRDLKRRSPVFSGDLLRTGPAANAQIKFTDGGIVALKPESALRIDDYTHQAAGGAQKQVMSLVKGGLRAVTGTIGKTNKEDYKLNTPVATIGIRGTLYEVWFDEEEGLGLAAWDGGIAACNGAGCLDLGVGADYRFGFVPLSGIGRGVRELPRGIGDAVKRYRHAALAGSERDPGEWRKRLVETDLRAAGLFGAPTVLSRDKFPKVGFVSFPGNTFARANYAQAVIDPDPFSNAPVMDWSLVNAATGVVLSAAAPYNCGGEPCDSWYANYQQMPSGAEVVWGSWSRVEVSLSSDDSATGLAAKPGYFVMADYVPREVIAAMTGSLSVNYANGQFDMSGDWFSTASGGLNIDFSTGAVSGSLQVSDSVSAGNEWQLLLAGTVDAGLLNLGVVTSADPVDVRSGSYFMPLGGTLGSEVAAAGTVGASFFGAGGTVDGVIGAVSVQTVDVVPVAVGGSGNVETLDGVFVMTAGGGL